MEIKKIDSETLAGLVESARQSPRGRSHLNMHPQLDDPIQRLLVAVEPDSYIRPHRHSQSGKWEWVSVLHGSFYIFIFDDKGRILDKHLLRAQGSGTKIIELPPGCWHSLLSLETGSVFFEMKPGPYTPAEEKDFAVWAPKEQAEAVPMFIDWLQQAEPGDQVITSTN